MKNREELCKEFQEYANKQRTGFLKEWKAYCILDTLEDIPGIMDDYIRFKNYLHSCLEMEGFSEEAIVTIQAWLAENFN